MNPEELDAEALQRARDLLGGDLDDVPDDEIRKTAHFAAIRFNLVCREFANVIYEQVKAALQRFDRGGPA